MTEQADLAVFPVPKETTPSLFWYSVVEKEPTKQTILKESCRTPYFKNQYRIFAFQKKEYLLFHK